MAVKHMIRTADGGTMTRDDMRALCAELRDAAGAVAVWAADSLRVPLVMAARMKRAQDAILAAYDAQGERITELEAACDSAMDALANGDLVGVHRHLLPVWSRDRG